MFIYFVNGCQGAVVVRLILFPHTGAYDKEVYPISLFLAMVPT